MTVEAAVLGTILGGTTNLFIIINFKLIEGKLEVNIIFLLLNRVTGILVMGFAIVCLCYNRHKRTPSSSAAADIDVISLNSLESTVIFDRHDKFA